MTVHREHPVLNRAALGFSQGDCQNRPSRRIGQRSLLALVFLATFFVEPLGAQRKAPTVYLEPGKPVEIRRPKSRVVTRKSVRNSQRSYFKRFVDATIAPATDAVATTVVNDLVTVTPSDRAAGKKYRLIIHKEFQQQLKQSNGRWTNGGVFQQVERANLVVSFGTLPTVLVAKGSSEVFAFPSDVPWKIPKPRRTRKPVAATLTPLDARTLRIEAERLGEVTLKPSYRLAGKTFKTEITFRVVDKIPTLEVELRPDSVYRLHASQADALFGAERERGYVRKFHKEPDSEHVSSAQKLDDLGYATVVHLRGESEGTTQATLLYQGRKRLSVDSETSEPFQVKLPVTFKVVAGPPLEDSKGEE